MSNPEFELVDLSGVTRFKGTAEPPIGGSQTLAQVLAAGNDGGGLPVENIADGVNPQDGATVAQLPTIGLEVFAPASLTTIADGAQARLPWENPSGDVLVNLADPTRPRVIEAGFYGVQVAVAGTSMTPDGFFAIFLNLDPAGMTTSFSSQSRLATVAQSQPATFVTMARYLPANAQIVVNVSNFDGASARDFGLDAAAISRIG